MLPSWTCVSYMLSTISQHCSLWWSRTSTGLIFSLLLWPQAFKGAFVSKASQYDWNLLRMDAYSHTHLWKSQVSLSPGNSNRNPPFSFSEQDKLHMSASIELLCLPFWTSPFIHMLLQVLNIRYMNSVLFMLMWWQQSEDSCISSYLEV